jgi:hypothetical protein
MAERVKSPKVMHVTLIDPERIQALKSGSSLLRWLPGLGFSLRQNCATHLTSGYQSRHAKLEYRLDRI